MLFYEHLIKAKQENKTFAVATVVQTQGRTPRTAGSKMLIFANGDVFGSIGGGIVEKQVIEDSLQSIKDGKTLLKTYSAIPTEELEIGMVCGNNMTVFIEPSHPAPYLYLCGFGHVAQAILPIAKSVGYHVVIIDSRDVSGFGNVLTQAVEIIRIEDFSKIADLALMDHAAYIICTFSHKTDGDALKAVLKKAPAYIGMLGGIPKIKALFQELKHCGFSEETIQSIHAPIGLDIGGEKPAEIAVSVIAEILAIKNKRSCRYMRDVLRPEIFPED